MLKVARIYGGICFAAFLFVIYMILKDPMWVPFPWNPTETEMETARLIVFVFWIFPAIFFVLDLFSYVLELQGIKSNMNLGHRNAFLMAALIFCAVFAVIAIGAPMMDAMIK
jgi:hypothetical protein